MKWLSLLICAIISVVLLTGIVSAVGNISVTTNPVGATVYVDSINKGTSPVTVPDLTSGAHNVLIQKQDYQDYTTSVTVTDNATATVTATLVASTPPPVISSINPTFGLNSGVVSITNLAGSGFTSGATVVLAKSGQTSISGTSVSVVSATQITCNFDITSKSTGNWNVIVTNPNPDSQSSTLSNGFEIRSPATAITLSSVTPSSKINDDVVTITNLAGTGFTSASTMKLKMYGANDIPGTITS
jgi:hypothetical protein